MKIKFETDVTLPDDNEGLQCYEGELDPSLALPSKEAGQ